MHPTSPAQIRAGRAMLDWSKIDLAKAANVSVSAIMDAEGRDPERVVAGTIGAIRVALETFGVRFVDDDGHGAGVSLGAVRDR